MSLPSCVWSSRREQLIFAALVAFRKEMSLLFEFPVDKTATKEEARKKKLNELKEALEAKKDIAAVESQKAYKLFCYFVVGKA